MSVYFIVYIIYIIYLNFYAMKDRQHYRLISQILRGLSVALFSNPYPPNCGRRLSAQARTASQSR